MIRNGYLKTLKESAGSVDEFEENWVKRFKNDKKGKKKSRKKQSLPKIAAKKKYLEDDSGKESEKTQDGGTSKERKSNKQLRWRIPIKNVQSISENEERRQGIFGKMMEYFCVYVPSKICPD